MRVKILRQQTPVSKPYWEIFNYEGPSDNTVAGLLDYLNYHDDITDINGNKTTRIGWECSCLQGMCGGCAMVINEVPSLACETFIKEARKRGIATFIWDNGDFGNGQEKFGIFDRKKANAPIKATWIIDGITKGSKFQSQ